MLLAKIALGFCAVIVLAILCVFHQGIIRVDTDSGDGQHVHLWFPAAVVPMTMHFVPKHYFQMAHLPDQDQEMGMAIFRTVARELRRYPDVELVSVDDSDSHVRIRTHDGKLQIDVHDSNDNVHVSLPLSTIDDISAELENARPGI
jgi:hypothetical protein